LGIGDWAQSPIPNPQSPIPNPQSPDNFFYIKITVFLVIINLKNELKIKNGIYRYSKKHHIKFFILFIIKIFSVV
jgi:hypothetical protein